MEIYRCIMKTYFINNVGELFPQAEAVLIFDFKKKNHTLSLSRSFKRNDFVIREKQGNSLDSWVLRRNRSLLVDDIRQDFRFDYSRSGDIRRRASLSFIASPISIAYKFLGIVRVESNQPNSFSLDDL